MISPIVLELAGLGGRAGVSGGISGTVRSEFAEGGKVKISGSAGGVNM